MADIHIEREHHLSLTEARQAAARWVLRAEEEFDMRCTYEAGGQTDQMSFSRAGVSGTLKVTAQHFEVDAQLGFFLAAFKDRIEAEILKNLDALLSDLAGPGGAGPRQA
jgi:putative polyhydroxyalkanoate system protein